MDIAKDVRKGADYLKDEAEKAGEAAAHARDELYEDWEQLKDNIHNNKEEDLRKYN